MDQLTQRNRAALDRILTWGEHPTATTLPPWAMEGLGAPVDCDSCGSPVDKTGACIIGCELQAVGS